MLWIIVLGIATGMRTMTGIAVVCWFAWFGLFPLQHTWAMWTTNIVSAIVFTVFALGEYFGDTRPEAPSRKTLFPATARILFGALVGAVMAAGLGEPAAGGVIFGVVGALIGTHAGYAGRMRGAKWFGRDRPAALAESAIALGLAIGSTYMLHRAAAYIARIEGPRTFF